MTKIKIWLAAMRLRTLPLAFSCIIIGSFLASSFESFDWSVFALLITTTLFLQILSNLANDLGDTQHGADNQERIGPKRQVQTGAISYQQMKKAVIVFALLSLVSGIALLIVSFGWHRLPELLFFFAVGIGAIIAAIKYTAGSNPYGYQGLGDVFVLLFFGFVGVCGTFYLHTGHFDASVLLPAYSVGCMATGVLNLNNMRDIASDKLAGKNSIPVRIGLKNARIYHAVLLASAAIALIVYTAITFVCITSFIYVILFVPLFLQVRKLFFLEGQAIDPMLKKLALNTLAISILFGLGLC